MINPVLSYSILWISLLFLFSLGITTNISEPLYLETIFLIGSNVFSLILVYTFLNVVYKKKILKSYFLPSLIPEVSFEKINKVFNKLIIVGFLISILYSGGLPIVWLIIGDSRSYVDYGIPTLGGLINALYSISLLSFLLIKIKKQESIISWRLLFYLLYPVVTINRGLFVVVAIESFCAMSFYFKQSIKKILVSVSTIILIIMLFGLLGDLRISDFDNEFKKEIVRENYHPYVNSYTSGFLWVYLYSTGSINNLNHNIVKLNPSFIPNWSLNNLMPSVLRDFFFEQGDYAFSMVTPLINTFTAYSNYLADFGLIITILIFIIMHTILVWLFFIGKSGNSWGVIGYSVMFSAHILSCFWDFYTIWYTISQVLLVAIIINSNTLKKIFLNKRGIVYVNV